MNRYNLSLTLKLTTRKKLLVSSRSGELDPSVDISFARTLIGDDAHLYIPGSTLKGVLRSTLIKLSGLLGHQVKRSIYPPELEDSTDLVCSIFGRPHEGTSKVYVKPVFLEGVPHILTHVRIDDNTRMAEEGGLFKAEYLPIGYSFTAELEARDLSLPEAEALLLAVYGMNYERFGRHGLLSVKVDMKRSRVPNDVIERSEMAKLILEVMRD